MYTMMQMSVRTDWLRSVLDWQCHDGGKYSVNVADKNATRWIPLHRVLQRQGLAAKEMAPPLSPPPFGMRGTQIGAC